MRTKEELFKESDLETPFEEYVPEKLANMTNILKAEDKEGNTVIYTGSFHNLKYDYADTDHYLWTGISLTKQKDVYRSRTTLLGKKKVSEKRVNIWKYDLRTNIILSHRNSIYDEKRIHLSNSYRDTIEQYFAKEKKIVINSKLLDGVFKPLEDQLIEIYKGMLKKSLPMKNN